MGRYLMPLIYLFLLFSGLMLYGKLRRGELEGELLPWILSPTHLESYAIALGGSVMIVGIGVLLDFLSKKGPFRP